MDIRVELSRPFTFLLILSTVVGGLLILMSGASVPTDSPGQGGDEPPQLAIHNAEDESRRARRESELADRHIEVLTYQLRRLEQERTLLQKDLSPEQDEEFRKGLRMLMDLIDGKRRADEKMVESFRQMWDANRAGAAAAALSDEDPVIAIWWPVEPLYGISAIFDDPEYEKYFGLPHKAVDIPALQETEIHAAADGIVEEIVDNGAGYNYLTVRHAGYVTLYGHVSAFLVKKGEHVRHGDSIALSGGMPGTPGAGNLTTGPHLHFEVITGKGNVNPLKYLPAAGVELLR